MAGLVEPLERSLARGVVRLRWGIIAGWAAVALAAILWLPPLRTAGTDVFGGTVPKDAPPVQAQREAIRTFGFPLSSHTEVALRTRAPLSLPDYLRIAWYAARVSVSAPQTMQGLAALVPLVNFDSVLPASSGRGDTVLVLLFFDNGLDGKGRTALATRVRDDMARLVRPSTVAVTGANPANEAQTDRMVSALGAIELATIAMVFAIAAIAFRSLLVPVFALASAAVAYVVATRIVGALASTFTIDLPPELEPLVVVLMVGVMTDYTMFYVSDFRNRERRGRPVDEAAEAAGYTVSRLVLAAGLLVAAGTATLAIARLDLIQRLGPTLALAAVVAILVAVTLIPAMLAVAGDYSFWPAKSGPGDPVPLERSWRYRLLAFITRRRVALPFALAMVALLAGSALLARQVELGANLVGDLPSSAEPAQGAAIAAEGFAPGVIAPTQVILHGPGIGGRRELLSSMEDQLITTPGVAGVAGPVDQPLPARLGLFTSPAGDDARFTVVLADDPYSAAALNTLDRLQRRVRRFASSHPGQIASVEFAGDTAISQAAVTAVSRDLVDITIAVVVIDFLILLLFLRSLLVSAILVGSSLLVVIASIGVTAWVFGQLGPGGLTFYVPFAVTVLLVAFGSDYNVYVVGRIWQSPGPSFREAIVRQTALTSRPVTLAGLILAVSFGLLSIVSLDAFREFAFAMVLGLLVDTMLVRTLLVPSLLALLGPASAWPANVLAHAPGSASEPYDPGPDAAGS